MKLLKPEIKYLNNTINKDIQKLKESNKHYLDWIERTKPTDPYYLKKVKADENKIVFMEKLLDKINNK